MVTFKFLGYSSSVDEFGDQWIVDPQGTVSERDKGGTWQTWLASGDDTGLWPTWGKPTLYNRIDLYFTVANDLDEGKYDSRAVKQWGYSNDDLVQIQQFQRAYAIEELVISLPDIVELPYALASLSRAAPALRSGGALYSQHM